MLHKAVLRWLSCSRKASWAREFFVRLINLALEPRHGLIVRYDDPRRKPIMDCLKRIVLETGMRGTTAEAYQIYVAVQNTAKVEGDMAEVGVAGGGSARIIREANRQKPLHLFDTFEGLPSLSAEDDPNLFRKGQYAASLDYVRSLFRDDRNVYFYPGLFPATGAAVADKRFSFVHLDVDLYQSTWDGLQFFYPRMSNGGIILLHDYTTAVGVRKAVDDFFAGRPEPVVELSCGTQCLVVKIG